ncbi:hypothetical protein CTEN210_11370 [Chaetoceros tenuissimus]|uniref:F-box/LRR-repeat protein 15-like leucin rich repeat domain-containing protein n=1 Tax=Chaetoceros tenuissimus TaxID=426638 RepID=A0AAD3CZM5_9STRA|nr:hypothetical protein CTEN210_11370 [Chaetoceros tenuissimus]
MPPVINTDTIDLLALSKVGIEITDQFVSDLIKQTKQSVLKLNLTDCNEITDLSLDRIGNKFKDLQEVILKGCNKISLVGIRSLALNCQNLKKISFQGYDIGDLGLRVIASNLVALEEIDLSGCTQVSDRGLSELGHCCRNLQSINLRGCSSINESGHWALCELEHCTKLTEIDLSHCIYLSDVGIVALTKRCPQLERIRINHCNVSARAVTKATLLCTNLVELGLAQTCYSWSREDVTKLLESVKAKIQILDLSQCQYIRAEQVELLCNCTKLKSLHLQGCNPIDKDVIMIQHELQHLETLSLSYTLITNEALEKFEKKEGGLGLSNLDVTECENICPAALENLVSIFPYSRLIVEEDHFVGFQSLPDEAKLRRIAMTTYTQRLASTCIQRFARGYIVRMIIWKSRRMKASVELGIPKLQAQFRRKRQVRLFHKLLEERKQYFAALAIQKCFKRFQWRCYYCNRQEYQRLFKVRYQSAKQIQSCYKKYRQKLEIAREMKLVAIVDLKRKQNELKRNKSAIRIQNMVRQVQARMKLLYLISVEKQRARQESIENQSSIQIQRAYRGFVGRLQAQEKRKKNAEIELRWKMARNIQCFWRVVQSKQFLGQLQYFQQVAEQEKKVVTLQSLWRSTLATRKVRLLLALKKLREREILCAIDMQRYYRGMKGRRKAHARQITLMNQQKTNASAIYIQRIYRGFLGREEYFAAKYLKSLEEDIKPIEYAINSCRDHIAVREKELSTLHDDIRAQEKRLKSLHGDLDFVSKTTKRYIDTTVLNGILQRCQTSTVKMSIKTEIEKVGENVDNRREALKEIQTELGKKKKECRDFEIKLLILTSNTKKKLMNERRQVRIIGARGSV